MFIQDTTELNRLIIGEELDDIHLEFAIEMCISDWNTTAPMVGAAKTISSFPSLYLLMHGAAIQCFKMGGMRQTRNELNYQSGGSSFLRSNKTPLYQSWINMFMNDYEMKKKSLKIAQNVASGYGEVWSEYDYIGLW